MTHCDVCSAELASNTELPEETVTRLSVLRRQQLERAGLARAECPISDYINAGLSLRVVSASGRGNMSPEAIMIQDARSRTKRADKCGFQSIEDRFEHDVQFMERMLQMCYDYRAAQRQDWLRHVHLANPPRNRAQVSLGLGYDEDHSLARLAYIDVAPDRFPTGYGLHSRAMVRDLPRKHSLLARVCRVHQLTQVPPWPFGLGWRTSGSARQRIGGASPTMP